MNSIQINSLKGKLYFHRFVCIIVAPTGSETRVLDMGKAFGTLMSDQVSKPLVCVRARARAHVRVRRFLCEGERRNFQKYACGCVRTPLIGADVRRTCAHSSFW